MTHYYPVQPALELSGMSAFALSKHAGLHEATIRKCRSRGFTEAMADKVATSIGYLPWMIWPEWLENVIADCSVPCAGPGCDERFVPVRKGHKFCSPRCRTRDVKQRAWAHDPNYRKRREAYMRAYRAEAKAAILAQHKRWIEANRDRVREQNRERMRRWRAAQKDAA